VFSRAPAGKRTTSPHRRTTSKASGRSELNASPVRWALITVALYREDRVDALFGSVEMCGRYYRLEDADGLADFFHFGQLQGLVSEPSFH
jgi:hypothetical protein